MKKFFIILATIFVIAGIALSVVSIAVKGFDFTVFETGKLVTENYDITDSFSEVSVSALTCDVYFKKSTDGGTHVECKILEGSDSYVNVENGTLTVKIKESIRTYFSVSSKSPVITVYVPSDVFSYTVSLSTGDTFISGLDAEKIKIHCTTGETKITSVHCGELDVSGTTGDVLLKDVTAEGKISVNVSTGDISLESVDASEMYLFSTTGDISGTVLTGKKFETKTSTGDISVPENGNGGICEIKTTTGDIKIKVK